MDTDNDGRISRAEFDAGQKHRFDFAAVDANKDGYLVRSELRLFGGREVKTLGDGFMATFDCPGQGIRCAQAIGQALEPLPFSIRAGLNTGECDLVGGDVVGLSVCIAARIGALARAREVLVPAAVKDLVLGSGITFRDRGRHRFKGVPGRWRLFSVASA